VNYVPHDLEWTPAKIGRIWDFFSQSLSPDLYFSAHSGAAIVERVDRLLGLRGRRILDFGCGRGDLLDHLFRCGLHAQGLEFSVESAAGTEARFADQPLFAGIVVAEELPSPLPAGSFDVVFLVEVIEHLLDAQIEPTLAEVRRLLGPKGVVVVTCPNAEDLSESSVQCPDCGAVFHRWQHLRSLGAESIEALFALHGFRTVQVEALLWGARRRTRLRANLRKLAGKPAYAPHLLYMGSPLEAPAEAPQSASPSTSG
jgi:SAM-dependent methyltransferase